MIQRATSILIYCGLLMATGEMACGQEIPPLQLSEFRPESSLKAPVTPLKRARYPVIDVHTHFGFRLKGDPQALDAYVATMNQHQIALCVSLDARLGEESAHLDYLAPHRGRFLVFAHLNFQGEGKDDEPATWGLQPARLRANLL